MKTQDQYLVFTIDEERYAMALSAVEKVIRTVELTSLPKAPEFLLGLINMKGKAIPVLDIRKRYNLPDREIRLDDRMRPKTNKNSNANLDNSFMGLPPYQCIVARNTSM